MDKESSPRLNTIKEAIIMEDRKHYDEYVRSQKSNYKYNTKPSDYDEDVTFGGPGDNENRNNDTRLKAKKFATRKEAEQWMKKHPGHRIVRASTMDTPAWVSRKGYDGHAVNLED